MSEHEVPSGHRRFVCTYLHRHMNTLHTIEVTVPLYGTQDPMSGTEGAAWRLADKLVESKHPVRLYDLARLRIQPLGA